MFFFCNRPPHSSHMSLRQRNQQVSSSPHLISTQFTLGTDGIQGNISHSFSSVSVPISSLIGEKVTINDAAYSEDEPGDKEVSPRKMMTNGGISESRRLVNTTVSTTVSDRLPKIHSTISNIIIQVSNHLLLYFVNFYRQFFKTCRVVMLPLLWLA